MLFTHSHFCSPKALGNTHINASQLFICSSHAASLSSSDRCELFSWARFVCPICSNVPNANRQLTPGPRVSPLSSLLFDTCGERMRETDGGNPQIPFTFSFHGCLGVRRRRRRCSNRPLVIFGCRCLSSAHRCNPSLLPHSLCCQIRHQIAQKSQVKRGKEKGERSGKNCLPPRGVTRMRGHIKCPKTLMSAVGVRHTWTWVK